jgi:hypothetical protein
METLELYHVPIDFLALRRIRAMLRRESVFIPSFQCSVTELYHPLTYPRQETHFGTETVLLVDRNLLIRWIALVRGNRPADEHRLPAAVLAFAQCTGIMIEPCMALHEAAATSSNQVANDELRDFRTADHIHTEYWANIALGVPEDIKAWLHRIPKLPQKAPADFARPLRSWSLNYIIALKIAELELQGGSSEQQMRILLKWMHEDFLFSTSGVALGVYYLAPNSNRRGILKHLRSQDRERAISGVRNQTWDLTLITEFITGVEEQEATNRLTILASLDRQLRKLARLFVQPLIKNRELDLELIFREFWGDTVGRRLAKIANEYRSDMDNPARRINRKDEQPETETLISEGETRVREWTPK